MSNDDFQKLVLEKFDTIENGMKDLKSYLNLIIWDSFKQVLLLNWNFKIKKNNPYWVIFLILIIIDIVNHSFLNQLFQQFSNLKLVIMYWHIASIKITCKNQIIWSEEFGNKFL